MINFLPRHLPVNLLIKPMPYKNQTTNVPISFGSRKVMFGNAFGSQIITIIIVTVKNTNPIIAAIKLSLSKISKLGNRLNIKPNLLSFISLYNIKYKTPYTADIVIPEYP